MQWLKDKKPVAGATNDALFLASATLNDDGNYSVLVSNADGSVETEPVSLTVVPTPYTPIYQQDFEGTVGSEWSLRPVSVTPVGGRRFLGELGNNTTTLTLDGLPAHDTAMISVDVLVIRSWDGNNNSTGPDYWSMVVPGVPTLLRTTFATYNWQGLTQSYPENSAASYKPDSFAREINTLGYFFRFTSSFAALGYMELDSVYRVQIPFPHSDSQLRIQFSGSHLQALADEAWGIDNVVVSIASNPAQLPIVAWGSNPFKQTNVPPILDKVLRIAAGATHSLAVLKDGTVVGWGNNIENEAMTPPGTPPLSEIAAGTVFSTGITREQTVSAWGQKPSNSAIVLPSLTNMVMIAAGDRHVLALSQHGSITAWGDNAFGQVSAIPTNIHAVNIAAGASHSLALASDGTVWAWGNSESFQTTVPGGLSDAVALAAGARHSLALRSDGTVQGWGDNSLGQATPPPGLNNVVAIAARGDYSMALRQDGSVVAWGANAAVNSPVPAALTNIVAIAAGGNHALALLGDGSPVITVQPFSRVASSGSATWLCAFATGAQPLRYQWIREGAELPGANTPRLEIANVTETTTYQLKVENALGTATSIAATLSVAPGEPPSILVQPVSVRIPPGGTATFEAKVAGTPEPLLQWFHGAVPLMDDARVSGATTARLRIAGVTPEDAGQYQLVATNAIGVIRTDPAALAVVQHVHLELGSAIGPNGFEIRVSGAPEERFELQTSVDLVLWESLAHLTNGASFLLYLDGAATNAPCRFYRAISGP